MATDIGTSLIPDAPARHRSKLEFIERIELRRLDGYLLALVFFLAYAVFSLLLNHNLITGGFDLGIFDQAVRNYAHFHAPIADIKALHFNILGDHFSPALAALSPFYWIRPQASTLLIVQAALIAISLVPVHRLAQDRLGRRPALAIALAYGLSFGIAATVAFDFHEVALAAPLLAFGLVALVEQRWRAMLAWTLPLLLVREEMGLYLAVIGVILLIRKQRKLGWWLVGIGVVWFALIVGLVIPHFNPAHTSPYLDFYTNGPQGTNYFVSGPQGHRSLGHAIATAPVQLVNAKEKIKTIVLVLAVSGLLAVRSPLMLLALLNLAVRFEAGNPFYWTSFNYDYGLVLMPILFIGYLDAYPTWRASKVGLVRRYALWSPLVVLLVALALVPRFQLVPWLVKGPSHYSLSSHQKLAYALIDEIPDGVVVETTDHLAPQLSDRCDVVVWPFGQTTPDWVLVDTTESDYIDNGEVARIDDLEHHGYRIVTVSDGFIMLQRGPH